MAYERIQNGGGVSGQKIFNGQPNQNISCMYVTKNSIQGVLGYRLSQNYKQMKVEKIVSGEIQDKTYC